MPIKVNVVQKGLEESIQRAAKNINSKGLHVNINDRQFTRPLGKITGSVSEFNKSLEASNARVLAFGASVGIIQGVQTAFKALISSAIEVEKKLTEINVVMGLTSKQLENFGSKLFDVARNTAQSFSTVASAATELARQGLTMEETLKRTNDALILTRLTGLDAASAVSGLTAALNTFNKAGLDSTQILSKMAAVDVQFAVSTEDLIDAVSRAGAVANDAGVSFDQLMGAVTAAQQMTARGGKVIGNSFKTIFTRVQRSSTITRLEELGIAVRDMMGNTLPAISVLENLAKTYDTLADTTKAAVAEQVGGVFQINILKAAIKDLSEENSILARATQLSSQATDEAYKKNELLNRSLDALVNQTGASIKELAATIGEIGFSDSMKDYLSFINDQIKGLSNLLSEEKGEKDGTNYFKGFVSGLGKVIMGPGLAAGLVVLTSLAAKTFAFLGGSVKELLGMVSASQKQKQIQESIVAVLAENSSLQAKLLSQEGNRAAQEKTILGILQAQAREQARISSLASRVAPVIAQRGYGPNLQRTRADGHIPNYVSKEEELRERRGAIKSGYTPGKIKSMILPGEGRVVYNSSENVKKFANLNQPAIMPPESSVAGRKYKSKFKKKHGFDPYKNDGLIPNYYQAAGASANFGNFTATKAFGYGWHGPGGGGGGKSAASGSQQRARIRIPGGGGGSGTRGLSFSSSEGFVPNFMKLNASSLKSIKNLQSKTVSPKINSSKFDEIITEKVQLLSLLSDNKFKSLEYLTSGNKLKTFHSARNNVHKYKKGVSAPKDYASWKDLDEKTGSKVLWVGSAGEKEAGYRRFTLEKILSIMSGGKKYGVNLSSFKNKFQGMIPNFALSSTPKDQGEFLKGLKESNPRFYNPAAIAKYETYKNPSKLNDLLNSPKNTVDAVKYLDNNALRRMKQYMQKNSMLGDADWKVVSRINGQEVLGANIDKELRTASPREIFNYLTGQTDRIQGNIPNAFLRLRDHSERSAVAEDIIGRSGISKIVKEEIDIIKRNKGRQQSALKEANLSEKQISVREENQKKFQSAWLKERQRQIESSMMESMSSLNKSSSFDPVKNINASSFRKSWNDMEYNRYLEKIGKGQSVSKAFREAQYMYDPDLFKNTGLVKRRLRNKGHIPNFAKIASTGAQKILDKNPEFYGAANDAIKRESSFGLTPKLVSAPSLRGSQNPGLAVVNQEQEGGSLGRARKLHKGLNPKQKTSAKKVPNFALTAGQTSALYHQAMYDEVPKRGMDAIEQRQAAVRSNLAPFSQIDPIVNKLNDSYVKHNQLIMQSNLRERIALGLLEKENVSRQNFAKQFLRKDAMAAIAGGGGSQAALAKSYMKYDGAEMMTRMFTEKAMADKLGDKKTSNAINSLIKNVEKQTNTLSNIPRLQAQALESSARQIRGENTLSSRFTGTQGFNPRVAEQYYGKKFLESKGIQSSSRQETAAIVSRFGRETRDEFKKFMQEKGVMSSNAQLARGGLLKGEFAGLMRSQSSTFLPRLSQLEGAVKNGDTATARNLRRQLNQEALRQGTSATAIAKLQDTIKNVEREAKPSKREGYRDRGLSMQRGGQNFSGGFYAGLGGGRDLSQTLGGKTGNLAGRVAGSVGGGLKNYFSSANRLMAGNTGLALSFALPMMSGMVQSQKAREERGVYRDGNYEIEEGRGRDVAASTLMGAGMGAMFGLPGLLVGGLAGFAKAMSQTTLTIQEQIKMREKEIAVISQNAQALSSVQNLSTARAEAFRTGRSDDVNKLDSQINQVLSGITEKSIIDRAVASVGDQDALSKLQKEIGDQQATQNNIQNFAMAINSKNSKNAGLSLASIISQNIANELTTIEDMNSAIADIKRQYADAQQSGNYLEGAELRNLRRMSNREGISNRGLGMAGFAGLGTFAAGAALSFTGAGASIGIPMMLAASGAAAGAGYFGQQEVDKYFADRKLEQAGSQGFDQTLWMNSLVKKGVLSQATMEPLLAALNKGETNVSDIAKYAEEAVSQMQMIRDNSNAFGNNIFDLNQKFKNAINSMVTDLEVSRINQSENLNSLKSITDISSSYMQPNKAVQYQGNQMRKMFDLDVSYRRQNQARENDVSLLRELQQNMKQLNLMPTQQQAIIDLIQKEGTGAVGTMADQRLLQGKYDISLTESKLSNIFSRLGYKGSIENVGSAGRMEVTKDSQLGGFLGTQNIQEQQKIIDDLQKNAAQYLQQGSYTATFSRDLDNNSRKLVKEMLQRQDTRNTILEAQINSDRRSLAISIKRNEIENSIRQKTEMMLASFQTETMKEENRLTTKRLKSAGKISDLQFQQSDMFRGFNNNDQENQRQTEIRKKIFDQEFAIRKAEIESRMRTEASRLLSDQNLIYALNNLGDRIDSKLNKEIGPIEPRVPSNEPTKLNEGRKAAEKSLIITNQAKVEEASSRVESKIKEKNKAKAEINNIGNQIDYQRSMEKHSRNIENIFKNAPFPEKPKRGNTLYEEWNPFVDGPTERYLKASKKVQKETSRQALNYIEENELSGALGLSNTHNWKANFMNWSIADQEKVFRNHADSYKARGDSISRDKLVPQQNKLNEIEKEISNARNEIKNLSNQTQQRVIKPAPTQSPSVPNVNIGPNNGPKTGEQEDPFEYYASQIGIKKSELYMNQLSEAQGLNAQLDVIERAIQEAKQSGGDMSMINQLFMQLAESYKAAGLELREFSQNFNIQEAQKATENFVSSLKTLSGAQSQISGIRNLTNLTSDDIAAQSSISSISALKDQIQKEKEYEILKNDPSATSLQKADAFAAANAQSIGTKQQRDELIGYLKQEEGLRSQLYNAERIARTSENPFEISQAQDEVRSLKNQLAQLDDSVRILGSQLERTTPRDRGVLSEIGSGMSSGLQQGFAQLEADSETIYQRLGQQLPVQLRDGLTDAMQAAINGSQKFGDAMKQVGIQLLQNIQRAFLQSASNRITGLIGSAFNLKLNSGGYVPGGSGVRDDVPALLTGGEYVMKKSSVEKYGVNFMESLNKGNIEGFSQGGGVNLKIGAPRAAERESYQDSNQDGSVTRYRVKKEKIGINKQLTAYAVANDRSIQKYLQEEESQFYEDVETKRQEKHRSNMAGWRKRQEKDQLLNTVLTIAGTALLNKGLDWAKNKYDNSSFAQKRFDKKVNKGLEEKGYYRHKGAPLSQKFESPSDMMRVEKMYDRIYQDSGPQGVLQQARKDNLDVTADQFRYKMRRYNQGGKVPSVLTGGEFVVNKDAVKNNGSAFMSSVNSGTLNTRSNQATSDQSTNITHGDVNVTINVSGGGAATSSGGNMNPSDFSAKVKSAVMEVIAKERRVGGSMRG